MNTIKNSTNDAPLSSPVTNLNETFTQIKEAATQRVVAEYRAEEKEKYDKWDRFHAAVIMPPDEIVEALTQAAELFVVNQFIPLVTEQLKAEPLSFRTVSIEGYEQESDRAESFHTKMYDEFEKIGPCSDALIDLVQNGTSEARSAAVAPLIQGMTIALYNNNEDYSIEPRENENYWNPMLSQSTEQENEAISVKSTYKSQDEELELRLSFANYPKAKIVLIRPLLYAIEAELKKAGLTTEPIEGGYSRSEYNAIYREVDEDRLIVSVSGSFKVNICTS